MNNIESIPRKLYRNILGLYSESCFRIGIETNFTFRNMTAKDYSVLAHEYIHFLQDITTSYGAFSSYAVSEFIKSAAEAIRQSPDGSINVPYAPEPADDNVFANFYLRSLTYGDFEEIDEITEVLELRNVKEDIESKDMDSFPAIEVDVVDGEGDCRSINFGACAVMESLAYMMERYIAPIQSSAPDFPYAIAEMLVQVHYPEFAKNPLNIIALLDASLLTSAPGHTFVCHVVEFKEDGWLPDTPEDVYCKVLDAGFKVSGSHPCMRTYEEEMEEMRKLAINSIETYFNDSMVKFRKWIEETYSRGFALRIERPYFLLDLARGGDIMHNPYAKFLIEELVGTPIMTNPRAEATIKSPNVQFESVFFLFPAVGQIIKLFDSGDCKCELKQICQAMGGPVDEKCEKEPWSHDVKMTALCPYSLLWHNWNFARCKPVIGKKI